MSDGADVSLPNAGAGPDSLSLSELAAEHDFLVLFFQRDHFCTNCRGQVQALADRYEEFRERDTEVVSILPESRARADAWQAAYDLPYPLLADSDATLGASYDQPVRFGLLGSLSDFFGRMPAVVLLDCRGDPEVAWSYRGRSTFDRPSIDDIHDRIDAIA